MYTWESDYEITFRIINKELELSLTQIHIPIQTEPQPYIKLLSEKFPTREGWEIQVIKTSTKEICWDYKPGKWFTED